MHNHDPTQMGTPLHTEMANRAKNGNTQECLLAQNPYCILQFLHMSTVAVSGNTNAVLDRV